MFALKNSAVLEIFPQVEPGPHSPGPHFLVLARQLGYQFQRLYAEPVGDEAKGDMRLPISQVMALKSNSDSL